MAVSQFYEFDDRSSGGHSGNGSYFTLSWLVNAMIIRDMGTQLSPAATQSLRSHATTAAGIRDWLILGPLDDSNAECIDNPDAIEPPPLNVSAQYPRKGGGIGEKATWQRARLNGSLAYLDFHQQHIHDVDGLGASALALTHVKLTAETPLKVLLVGSTAGVGVGWLGGVEIFRDELNAGLMLSEERAEIVLQPGWNTLLVRSCTKWRAQGWGLWFGLRSLSDAALGDVGVSVDACGPLC